MHVLPDLSSLLTDDYDVNHWDESEETVVETGFAYCRGVLAHCVARSEERNHTQSTVTEAAKQAMVPVASSHDDAK